MKSAAARTKQASAKAEERKPLYESAGFAMVRAPLLPVEVYLDPGSERRQAELFTDPRVRCALAIGSTSLVNAIERFRQSGLSRRDADRMQAKLRRYRTRMSTRPTPYGLFAGVGLASWGMQTDLEILSTSARTRTRPDMAWLMDLVFQAESDPAIRRHLRLTANPLAITEGGRVFLAERAPAKGSHPGTPVSLRATGAVKLALGLARTPQTHRDLAAALSAETKGATEEKVEKLLSELWGQTLLLTDLRPPLTMDDPAAYVASKLRSIPPAAAILAKLDGLICAAARWDALRPEEKSATFEELLAGADAPLDGSKQIPVQTDMAMSIKGCINEAVAREAERAASLLVRLSPAPRGSSRVAAYRQAFVNRYGSDREVNLLEMLDAQRGLGPHSGYGYAHTGPNAAKSSERARVLLKLACSALRDRRRIVLLDQKTIDQLATGTDEQSAPLSIDLNVLVAARSRAAVDSGDFTLVIGPNLGAQAGGRNLGRFAGILGLDGNNALRELAEAEEERTPDEIWAELVYLPNNVRMANVTIRPMVREFQAVFGTTADEGAGLIPIDELVAGIENGRMYVRWPVAGKRVRFSEGHMLTHHNAPAVVRFLSDLSSEGGAIFSSFDWGPAESFPFLPRVQTGRIVLRPAQWRVHKDTLDLSSPEEFRKSLDEWRDQWDVPQRVYLAVGDNRLILNLEEEEEAGEFMAEAQKLKGEQSLLLQELLPSLEEAWLSGPEGHYYSELVISLVRCPQARGAVKEVRQIDRVAAVGLRNLPPGSEWLFAKLYCPRYLEDELITGPLLTFVERALKAKLADGWFFIRYSDPQRHVRLRFHGPPRRLATHLFAHLCEWASGLVERGVLQRFLFDTYERELERYGGAEGMIAAEELFAVDSLYSARILRTLQASPWPHEETSLLALSIDDLLESLGFSDAERLKWLAGQTNARAADIGAEYRKCKNELRAAVGNPDDFLASVEGGRLLADHFAARRIALAPFAETLRRRSTEARLTQSLDRLCASFVHLHLNRIASGEAVSEHRILSLLLRTRESLKQAPMHHD